MELLFLGAAKGDIDLVLVLQVGMGTACGTGLGIELANGLIAFDCLFTPA